MAGHCCSENFSLVAKLLLGSALSAIAITSAQAQTVAQADNTPETVVVTGTSIRGQAPVGTNLITMDRSAIETTGAQTVQQLLSDMPQINNFGRSSQGGNNSDFSGGFAPAIHGIGGGSSSATLVLIDGHRFPTQGLTESQADPTVLPASALERVEVLPDGDSSIYGSDAVAGVINFITRKDFTGFEMNVQGGVADRYNTFTTNATFGHTWSGGSVMMSYDYTSQSDLMFGSRKFMTARQDIRMGAADPSLFTGLPARSASFMTTTPAVGPGTSAPFAATIPYPSRGVNFENFNCGVATIAASSSAPAFYYQPGGGYGGPSYSTSTNNQPSQGACAGSGATGSQIGNYASVIPSTVRHSGIIEINQEITENLAFNAEMVYGSRLTDQRTSRGDISAEVFGPTSANTSQINPFYVGNATTGTSAEYIRYDFNDLLGPGANTKQFDTNEFVVSGLTYDLGGERELTLSGTAGQNINSQHITGVVSTAEALLALNGTTNTNGTAGTNSEQDVYGLGTVYPGARALNVNNALDVWDPVGSNKTSAAVLRSLKDGGSVSNANQGLEDLVAKFDGPIFSLPAGAVKIAAGGEYLHQTFDEYGAVNNSVGPSLANSSYYSYREGRSIYSGFIEASVPLVGPDMNVPLVESFSIDAAGRYDKYSGTVGDTANPKFAFDWLLVDGIKARGSWGTSFVAPLIHDDQNFNSQSQISAASNPSNPVIPFGTALPFNGGAGVAGTWVASPSTCAAGNGTVVNSAGQTITAAGFPGAYGCKINFSATNGAGTSAALSVAGGNGSLKPATGRSWSLGADIDFGKLWRPLAGATLSATFWDTSYHGLITNQQTQNNIPQLTFFAPPGGWTPQSAYIQGFLAGRPITIALPSSIWATVDGRLQNAFNIWENGVDFSGNYFYPTETAGTYHFGIDGTELLRYSTQGGTTNPILSTLNGDNSPRYNSQQLMFRAHLGWAMDAFTSDFAMNFIQAYNINASNFPYNLPGPGRGYPMGAAGVFTSAGTAHIGALTNFDLSLSYALPEGVFGLPDLVSSGSSVSMVVQNIFNTAPPFDPTTANGFTEGNPIGRLVTVALRKKF
jgi:iron complex outermembrane receptor protein